MKKDLFMLTALSCFASTQENSKRLKPELAAKYNKVNCKMTLKRVIDLGKRKIEEQSSYIHCGNTNPEAVNAFDPYINGIESALNEKGKQKFFLNSPQIIKGVIVEIEYNEKIVVSKFGKETHIVPVGVVKIIDYINVEKANKVEDKVTRLF
jgi:hypothetical protein